MFLDLDFRDLKVTRGIRNCNPANIRRSSTKWAYLRRTQSDSQFCQFTEMKYGIRAFFVLMKTYRYKYGLKTPSQILQRFAPPSENDLDAYRSFLSSHLIDIDKPILSDTMYCIFAKWIFRYESNFVCSVSYLEDLLKEFDFSVINPKKECYELSVF